MSDLWATPQEVFDNLNTEFNFDFDICAQDETAKCEKYNTIDDDSLSVDWSDLNATTIWCNPPYSNITPWIERAIQAQMQGVTTVMLVMCDPSVKWFARALGYASEIRFVTEGRLSFIKDKKAGGGNTKGSVIFVFRPSMVGTAYTSYVTRNELMTVPSYKVYKMKFRGLKFVEESVAEFDDPQTAIMHKIKLEEENTDPNYWFRMEG